MQLIVRDPFSFPGYRAPGFNNGHIASPSTLFSGIAMPGGGFLNLLNGTRATLVGTPGFSIDGIIGPCCSYLGGVNTATDEFPAPTTSFTTVTMAAIFKIPSFLSSNMYLISNSNGTNSFAIGCTATTGTAFIIAGTTNTLLGFTPAVNVPYLLVASISLNSAISSVLVNLNNGSIVAGNTASTGTSVAGDGTFYVGNRPGFPRPLNGYIAAAMFSSAFSSQQQLNAWAQSPWDFWYPPSDIEALYAKSGSIFVPWGYENDFAAVINRFNVVSH